MISVLILTKNEEQDLPGCLQSVFWCDDVHVFDSFSTDNTLKIAIEAGATITQRKFDNWSAHQNWALGNIPFKHKWVLYIDADERVSESLKETVLNFDPSNDDVVSYEIQRRDFAWNGRWLKHAQISPYYLRLFRPDKMRYERLVNPVSIPDGGTLRINGYLDHYPFSKGITHWLSRHLGYATFEASTILESVKKDGSGSTLRGFFSNDFTERRYYQKQFFYKIPSRHIVKWLYMVVWRKAFLDGSAGLTYATLQSIYEYFIILKMREMSKKQKGVNVEYKLTAATK